MEIKRSDNESLEEASALLDPSLLLDVKNLQTRFALGKRSIRAVNGISFYLKKGEALGIVGESGCGKSLSMLSLMRLLESPPAHISADRIWLDGRDITHLSSEEMASVRGAKIGMIFQNPSSALNPVLTIGSQISESLRAHQKMGANEAKEVVIALLRKVGIADPLQRYDEYPFQFSGGMRQRAMIASAMSCAPRLLIADEPTTALDVTIQAQILEMLRALTRKDGMGLILITHSFAVASQMCDRIMVMYAGHVLEEAPAQLLFASPKHPYTEALLESIPKIEGAISGDLPTIFGAPPDLGLPTSQCPFLPRCARPCEEGLHALPPLKEINHQHFVRCWRYES